MKAQAGNRLCFATLSLLCEWLIFIVGADIIRPKTLSGMKRANHIRPYELYEDSMKG